MSMGKSGMYGVATDDEGIRTIHEAIDRGVTLIDTGDFYAMGDSEMLVGRAPKFVPIIGARRPSQLDVLDVADRPLTVDEVGELERLVPKNAFKGSRYTEEQMTHLDSEK